MVLIIILSFMYYLNMPVNTSKVLYIPQGSINKIITQLQAKKYNVSKLDSILLRVMGSPQSGWINMGTNKSTRADFLYKLTTAKAALRNITLIPGETTYIFLNQLAENLNLDRDVLQSEYDKYAIIEEGAFVPDTYSIPIDISERDLIRHLLSQSMYKMKKLSQRLFGTYNEKKWFKYIAMASVIQKESAM